MRRELGDTFALGWVAVKTEEGIRIGLALRNRTPGGDREQRVRSNRPVGRPILMPDMLGWRRAGSRVTDPWGLDVQREKVRCVVPLEATSDVTP
jgi:hypothetical protein